MATNEVFKNGWLLSLVVTHPATPLSGQPVRCGLLTGVAQTDERADGTTSVDLGPTVWNLSAKAVNDAGNSAIALFDPIYYVDADTPVLSKKASGTFFGWALEAVTSGATATIRVAHVPQMGVPGASLTGANVGTVADANVIGGIPVVFRIDIPDAATGDVDVVVTNKIRVIEAWAVKTGGAGGAANTVQVKNTAAVITDAMSINIADTLIVRAASIDDAAHEIAAGGILRITRTKAGGNAACVVYVEALRVA